MHHTIFKPPPTRVIDFTRMNDNDIKRELKAVQADVDHLATHIKDVEEYLIQQAYRG